MHSHLSGVKPPYRLPSDTLYFHDWRYVRHGSPNADWRTESGKMLPLFFPEPVPTLHYESSFHSAPGIRLKAQPAARTEPIIAPDNSPFSFFLIPGNSASEGSKGK